jgi:hypothetical protein
VCTQEKSHGLEIIPVVKVDSPTVQSVERTGTFLSRQSIHPAEEEEEEEALTSHRVTQTARHEQESMPPTRQPEIQPAPMPVVKKKPGCFGRFCRCFGSDC